MSPLFVCIGNGWGTSQSRGSKGSMVNSSIVKFAPLSFLLMRFEAMSSELSIPPGIDNDFYFCLINKDTYSIKVIYLSLGIWIGWKKLWRERCDYIIVDVLEIILWCCYLFDRVYFYMAIYFRFGVWLVHELLADMLIVTSDLKNSVFIVLWRLEPIIL
jgi:hypothetical protein